MRKTISPMLLMSGLMLVVPTAVAAHGDHAGHAAHKGAHARAELVDAQGQGRGLATFKQADDGIRVTLKGIGLPAGVHAVHLHTTGSCTGPDFTSAGGHWNPGNKQHGHDNPAGAHMGDMPNVTAAADGTATLEAVVKGARLKDGAHPLLDTDGGAIIIHAAADDYKSDPTGNAGGRLACGVVKAE